MIIIIVIFLGVISSFILLWTLQSQISAPNSKENFVFQNDDDDDTELDNTIDYNISINGHNINILHVLPKNLTNIEQTKDSFIQTLSLNYPIIIYVHGLLFTKLFYHRVGLYEVLQTSNYHIITFDYTEMFPDTITKDGSLLDIKSVYDYYNLVSPNSNIILWGHSLGSSVVLNLINTLEDTYPTAVILENPFNSFNGLSYVKQWILDLVIEQEMVSENSKKNIPILIMHSTYDYMVPLESTIDLFRIIKLHNKNVHLAIFDEFVINGHTDIYKIEKMPSVVDKFIHNSTYD
uniref:Serine aminopeptidase S33 domain-containing protein n=1 Tax=viral metagenome TaxID=1070528 RepID=A0A6C0J874_9ZZZZ